MTLVELIDKLPDNATLQVTIGDDNGNTGLEPDQCPKGSVLAEIERIKALGISHATDQGWILELRVTIPNVANFEPNVDDENDSGDAWSNLDVSPECGFEGFLVLAHLFSSLSTNRSDRWLYAKTRPETTMLADPWIHIGDHTWVRTSLIVDSETCSLARAELSKAQRRRELRRF